MRTTSKNIGYTLIVLTMLATYSVAAHAEDKTDFLICNSKSPTTNVRSGAGARDFKVLDTLPNGTKVTVIESGENMEGYLWHNVRYENPTTKETKTGWVYSEAINATCYLNAAKTGESIIDDGSDPFQTANGTKIYIRATELALQERSDDQFAVGKLLLEGKEVQKNEKAARVWMNRSARQGYEPAITWLKEHPGPNVVVKQADAPIATSPAKAPVSTPTPAPKYIDISSDPTGCSGKRIPTSLLTRADGILSSPKRGDEIVSVKCKPTMVNPMFGAGREYYDIEIGVRSTHTMTFYGQTHRCEDKIIFRAESLGSGGYYLYGEAGVFSEGRAADNDILICPKPYLVKNEQANEKTNTRRAVFFLGNKVFLDRSDFKAGVEEERLAEQRLYEDAKNAFANLIESQPDGQALYLLGGKYEREADTQKAKTVYERVISKFASSEWAVKANDRLLAMRADANAASRASNIQSEMAASRDQARRLCENKRDACWRSCTANYSFGSARDACEKGCQMCN